VIPTTTKQGKRMLYQFCLGQIQYSAGLVQAVENAPWAAGQPGPGVAEDAVVGQVAAPPGTLPLEWLE
jgi:hypothetical protein